MNLINVSFKLVLIIFSLANSRSTFPAQSLRNDSIKQFAEKVYLHIDRESYTSGDDLWFKAYVIDPSTNRLSYNTNNLHVELLTPDSKIVQSRTIRITIGLGKGDFQLADSIPSGIYRIRAYTNHMRNYDDLFFFLKEITVINPYDNGGGLNRYDQKIQNKIEISFFPEGGSLIDNVTSTVGFKAVNALGKGCDVTVELYSSAGELITIFNSTHLGMGFFNIKPVPGYSYYTIVKGKDGTEIKARLPSSFPTGVAIRTFLTPDKNLILTVNTNEVTLPSVLNHEFKVNLSSRNLVSQKVKIKLDSLVNNYLVPLDSLPDGIIRVTLSEFEGLPLAERLFFLQRNDDTRINVITDKAEYKPREKISVFLSLSGDPSFSGTGDFSFSAAESQFTDNSSPFPVSIASWFLLESDVHGPIEQPSYYFDPENKKRLQKLDLLLMTQGWRDFKWKYDSVTSFKHEIGFRISGNVKRMLNNKPVEGAKINLGLFSYNSSLFLDTKTDKKGSYIFDELDIYGNTKAFISSTNNLEKMSGRIFVDPIQYNPPDIEHIKPDTIEFTLASKNLQVFQQEAIIRINNLKKYKLSDTINLGEVSIIAKRAETPQELRVKENRRFYATPDKELLVTPAMENYGGDVFSFISGRIPGVQVKRGINPRSIYYPDDVEIYIRNQFSYQFSEEKKPKAHGALILLDGYEVDTMGLISILTLPMKMVDRIDVLNASPLYGMRGANGVINIITYQGFKRNPIELSPNSVFKILSGFDIPRIFYSPGYNSQESQTIPPDVRSTIFWQPDIKIEKNKSFELDYYNADSPAIINITAEGVTEEGIPLTGKTRYEVK